MRKLLKYTTLSVAGVALLGLAGPAPALAQQTITITSWGGAYSMSQRKAYYEPFTKETGIQVLEDEWDGSMSKVQAMVDTGNYTTQVIDSGSEDVIQGCDEGILAEIDYKRLGGRDRFIPGAARDCGVATISFSTIYAYDGDAFPEGGPRPSTIGDLFDAKAFPGPRTLRKKPQATLETALMADGVKPSQVYEVLGTDEGVNRAFAVLDRIKPSVKVWWTAGAQTPQLLADKEVVMGTTWNGRIFNAVKNEGKNFVIVWDGQLLDYDFWVIPKGLPNYDMAMRFIEFASRPKVMATQSQYISYGPTVKAVMPLINPAISKDLPTAPENTKNYIVYDSGFWADHQDELEERYNAWLAQ